MRRRISRATSCCLPAAVHGEQAKRDGPAAEFVDALHGGVFQELRGALFPKLAGGFEDEPHGAIDIFGIIDFDVGTRATIPVGKIQTVTIAPLGMVVRAPSMPRRVEQSCSTVPLTSPILTRSPTLN